MGTREKGISSTGRLCLVSTTCSWEGKRGPWSIALSTLWPFPVPSRFGEAPASLVFYQWRSWYLIYGSRHLTTWEEPAAGRPPPAIGYRWHPAWHCGWGRGWGGGRGGRGRRG